MISGVLISDCALTILYCAGVVLIIILYSGLFVHALFDNVLEQCSCFYSFVHNFFRLQN